jgi:LacI family transcriptional regulator
VSTKPSQTPKTPARPVMREVAERAGVAMSSVSRVLSGHPDVSPKMSKVVMDAVHELGYRPDMLAQGLRSGRSFSIGFTVSDIANPVIAEVVTGAEKYLRSHGYSILLTDSEGNPDLDVEHIALLEQRRVDGLILSLAEENHARTVKALREVQVPVVLIDRDVPPLVHAGCAAFDHAVGMRAATHHLLEFGHRAFALIVGGPERPKRERRRGVEEALSSRGGDTSLIVHEGEFSAEHGRRAATAMLASNPRPTALIAGGNLLMQGALFALRDAGIVVGRDISFVGCDDVALAELHQPPIAVVRRDMAAAGAAAAELLLGALSARNNDGFREVTVPTEFVPRPSCARVT